LNIWRPDDFEMDFNYYSANVGMRSSIMDIRRRDEMARFKALLRDADVFFANRRPGFIEQMGLSTHELAVVRPGIVHVDISIYGPKGPWANRIGLDQTAGGVAGVLALEGSVENPKLPEIFVVNDYVSSWMASIGAIAALKCRAIEGGSYLVRISLAASRSGSFRWACSTKATPMPRPVRRGSTNIWRQTSSRLRRLAATTRVSLIK
jgi:crotonobetainyl-CoA:carnitine CoA-transferase CaiB-like acyl-CoA transferase